MIFRRRETSTVVRERGLGEIPDAQGLYLVRRIWMQRIHLIHLLSSRISGKSDGQLLYVILLRVGAGTEFQLAGDLLQLTVSGADAGRAEAVVLGEDQFDIDRAWLPGLSGSW